MAGVVEGATLGAVFQMLFSSVVQASLRPSHFRSRLNSLKYTLNFIQLAIQDIEMFNRILDRPARETEAFTVRLRNAQQVIQRSSDVKWWNVLKRVYYARKLRKLHASLVRFFQIDVAALEFRDNREILVAVSRMESKIKEMATILMRRSTDTEIEEQEEKQLSVGLTLGLMSTPCQLE